MSGIINSAGSKSGVLGVINDVGDLSKVGASCSMYMTSHLTNQAAGSLYLTGYTQRHNDDTALFTQGSTSTNGITVGVAGWYRYDINSNTNTIGADSYEQIRMSLNASSQLDETYTIKWRLASTNGHSTIGRSGTTYLGTGTYGLWHTHSGGTLTIEGGTHACAICLTYLRA